MTPTHTLPCGCKISPDKVEPCGKHLAGTGRHACCRYELLCCYTKDGKAVLCSFHRGYFSGYAEAQRWRGFDEEMPEIGANILVRLYENPDHYLRYVSARLYPDGTVIAGSGTYHTQADAIKGGWKWRPI